RPARVIAHQGARPTLAPRPLGEPDDPIETPMVLSNVPRPVVPLRLQPDQQIGTPGRLGHQSPRIACKDTAIAALSYGHKALVARQAILEADLSRTGRGEVPARGPKWAFRISDRIDQFR